MYQRFQCRLIHSASSYSAASHHVSADLSDKPEPKIVNPFELVAKDLDNLYVNIKKGLWTEKVELEEIASYYFDGQGKAFRPTIVVLVARALNYHVSGKAVLSEPQKTVAMATEMIVSINSFLIKSLSC